MEGPRSNDNHALGSQGENRRRLKVCYFHLSATPMFSPEKAGPIGGAELQTWIQGTLLAPRMDVVFIVDADPTQELQGPQGLSFVRFDAKRMVQRANRFPPGLRSLALRVESAGLYAWRTLQAVDADIYVQRAAGPDTLPLALFCRLKGRRFVYEWASDINKVGTGQGKKIMDFLFRLGRKLAHLQLVQTQAQMNFLGRREKRHAIRFPNLLDPSQEWRPALREHPGEEVLWVGAIRPEWKRPDLFLDLVAALPQLRFRMVGRILGPASFQLDFRDRASRLPNLTLHGAASRSEMPALYQSARCLVNVSDFEGMSNTFLEAMACGVPVVSLRADPQGILSQGGAGACLQGDIARLAPAVTRMFEDDVWLAARDHAIEVARTHGAQAGVERLAHLLENLGRPGPSFK